MVAETELIRFKLRKTLNLTNMKISQPQQEEAMATFGCGDETMKICVQPQHSYD